MRCLVAYYSWTGSTAKVARAIAAALSADVEDIREVQRRSGLFSFVRSAIEASQRKSSTILSSSTDAGAYDLVILGTPVWAGEMAPALRAYIAREKKRFKEVALFCTLGGANGKRALAGMRAACGRDPIAELLIDAASLKSGWRGKVHEFTQSLASFATRSQQTA